MTDTGFSSAQGLRVEDPQPFCAPGWMGAREATPSGLQRPATSKSVLLAGECPGGVGASGAGSAATPRPLLNQGCTTSGSHATAGPPALAGVEEGPNPVLRLSGGPGRVWAAFGGKLRRIVDSKYFNRGIMVAILTNTLSMGVEYHEQPDELTNALEISNIVFTSVFALEMLLKLLACGPLGYIRNPYNIFDGIIVVISVWEIVGQADGGLSVLRTFRLLRVLKLVRFMPALRRQLVVLMKTMDNVATFCMLLMLFIFIFSILGMHLFGCKFSLTTDTGDTVPDRKNFDSLLWAIVTVFQILTQEDWNVVLYNGMASTSSWAALYFVALMTFGNYVLFNLLVAILVEGFQAEGDANRSDTDEDKTSAHLEEDFDKFPDARATEVKMYPLAVTPNGHLEGRGSLPPPLIMRTAATPMPTPKSSPHLDPAPGLLESRRGSSSSVDPQLGDQKSLVACTLLPHELVLPLLGLRELRGDHHQAQVDHEEGAHLRQAGRGSCACWGTYAPESHAFGATCSAESCVRRLVNTVEGRDPKTRSGVFWSLQTGPGRLPAQRALHAQLTAAGDVRALLHAVVPARGAYKGILFALLCLVVRPQEGTFPSPEAQRRPYYADYSPTRRSIHSLCTSHYLDLFITFIIGVNVITMSMEHYNQPKSLDEALKYCNYVFTIVFVFEAVLKLVAFGFRRFFKDRWNQLDLAIVLLSIMGITLEEIEMNAALPINPTIIRIMRVLRIARVLKLLKMATGMRALLDTVVQALPQVGNLGLLFMLLFFIYAALGVELFGRLECSDDNPCEGLSRHATFSNFGMAFLTLFRVSTGDNWNGIMKESGLRGRPGGSQLEAQSGPPFRPLCRGRGLQSPKGPFSSQLTEMRIRTFNEVPPPTSTVALTPPQPEPW
ncbi:voltage-dependent T-type calcium channel subunit alpha-1H-like [Puma concolor]|uniref:Voltage-dependent T-type calcium channel subunit alpha-1H-like n=1 Tax=Puma concolor TaxID=9696 RepID=A0A6P6HTF7_PUMCO|nr:voltage-dependent T-type calcium channel subunit alpha-1H-like [Puma concolor]